MMKLTGTLLLTAALALPLTAQGGGGGSMGSMPGMRMGGDPTNKVSGTGQFPDGYQVRFDPSTRGPAPSPTDVKMVKMGSGYHVTGGPAAIYYKPTEMGKGEFSYSARFAQAKSMMHESYGIFIAGSHLQDSAQTYLYLVIRPLDGGVAIRRRMSDARPTAASDPMPMTPGIATVNKDDASDGHATNTLTIHVARDTVHFLVNGQLVKAVAKSALGGTTDGIVGLRINHNIDVHVDNIALK